MIHFLISVLFTGALWLAQLRATLYAEHTPIIFWPSDKLETLFILAELSTRLQLPTLSAEHYALEVITKSDSVEELFFRLELAIRCLREQSDPPSDWDPRSEYRLSRPFIEFIYSIKNGYREPVEIRRLLLEKIAVLHYLIESLTEEQFNLYYPYYLIEFGSVIDDAIDVLALTFEMS